MLASTEKLISHLQDGGSSQSTAFINACVYAVLQCGDQTDADAILRQYLTNPFESVYTGLLPVFRKFGNRACAEQLFELSIRQGKLAGDAQPEILEVLAQLQFAPIKQLLLDYVLGRVEADYYISRSAALGLLHFDCTGHEAEITAAIENCYGKNLFPEFVPALVCKLPNRGAMLEKLYELGSQYASADCNAGIVLGFALCGEEGKPYFQRILFDPGWEVAYGSTGTLHVAYKGLRYAGISFRQLYHEVKSISEPAMRRYAVILFLELLNNRINDIDTEYTESCTALHRLLFDWKSSHERDNLIDLAETVEQERDAYSIKSLLELKMKEEAILGNCCR